MIPEDPTSFPRPWFGVATLLISVSALLLSSCQARTPWIAQFSVSEDTTQKDNSLCYVCHLELEAEELTKTHIEEDITCAGCHGPSYDHMHDEMLMTTPDHLFGRAEVKAMCRKCHEPHERPEKVAEFLEKWRGRDRPNGRVISDTSICTDCHGLHNIRKKEPATEGAQEEQWTALFNGEDLGGWQSVSGRWEVQRGRIIGAPSADGGEGSLLSESSYRDFLLAVTFRCGKPLQASVSVGALQAASAARIEISSGVNEKLAPTGSVSARDGELALINLRMELHDPEGWNTLSAEVRGGMIRVWLNGEEVGAVHIPGLGEGRVGVHVEKVPEGDSQPFSIREVLLRSIATAESVKE